MNMKTKKNIGILILTIAVIFAIVKGGTSLAYFFTQKAHDSDYQLSKIQTEIDEEFKQDNANTFTKNPKIKNIGQSDCVVRVKVIVSPSSVEQNLTLDGLYGNEKWTKNETDGYYYYQGVLSPNKATESLFNKVTVVVDKVSDFDIIVYNEAIQVNAYNDDGKQLSALDENGHYNQANAYKLWQYYK
ncbi:MAG: hypothetical protein RR630_01255 [Coprobacillus sp.]